MTHEQDATAPMTGDPGVEPIPQDVPGISLTEAIGQGGFGTVYRAQQISVNREVAVKIDKRELTTDSDRRRYLREVTATAHVSSHPNIVSLYDGGMTESNRPYMVMELCPGGSVNDRLKAHGPIPVREVVEIGVAIADALAAAHSSGILHRDVKPANILITRYNTPALTDFGLASLPAEWGIETMSQAAFTPAYAPPEVFVNSAVSNSVQGDVYSLGATLYSMLLGRPARWTPKGAPSLAELVHSSQEPLPALTIPGAPGLMEVLSRATWPDPSQRIMDAATLRTELHRVLSQLEPDPVVTEAVPIADQSTMRLFGESATHPRSPSSSPASPPPGYLHSPAVGHSPTQAYPAAFNTPATGPNLAPAPPAKKKRRTGLIVGAVAAALALIIGGGAWALNRPDAPQAKGAPQASTSTPPESTAPTETPPPPGECWGGMTTISGFRQELLPRDCSQEHRFETFASGILSAETTSAKDDFVEVDPVATATCTAQALDDYVGHPQSEDMGITIMGPTAAEFKAGKRYFACLVSSPEGETVGSLKDG